MMVWNSLVVLGVVEIHKFMQREAFAVSVAQRKGKERKRKEEKESKIHFMSFHFSRLWADDGLSVEEGLRTKIRRGVADVEPRFLFRVPLPATSDTPMYGIVYQGVRL